jgi:hypothetical protein
MTRLVCVCASKAQCHAIRNDWTEKDRESDGWVSWSVGLVNERQMWRIKGDELVEYAEGSNEQCVSELDQQHEVDLSFLPDKPTNEVSLPTTPTKYPAVFASAPSSTGCA